MRDHRSRVSGTMNGVRAIAAGMLLGCAVPGVAVAQGGTDVWVSTFSETGTQVSAGRPLNVTRRAGYDNQPSFSADGRTVFYTSIREDAQADIWRVAAAGGPPSRVTDTPESEYSALLTPDRLHLSVIRVERDSTQRLWKFPLDGGSPALVLRALRPVGYHVWVGDYTLGTFVLGSPNALVVVDARTERADTLARGIGRALVKVPGRDAFSFVQQVGDTAWISEADVRTRTVTRLASAPARTEYHVWTPAGQLIIASGSRLWIRVGGRWDMLADFAELGVRGISRLALSPSGDRLAFVAEDSVAP